MRSRPVICVLFGLLCLAGAYYFWRVGSERAVRSSAVTSSTQSARPASSSSRFKPGPSSQSRSPIVSAPQVVEPGRTNLSPAELAEAKRAERLRYRLSNSSRSPEELMRSDRAILLENALIDTESPTGVLIPPHLRSRGDGGSYIVQWRGALDAEFYGGLREAGAQFVSYFPNNAALVRASAGVADRLRASPRTQAVLPFEPYYKLKSELLRMAVNDEALPQGSALNVLLFGDAREVTERALRDLGLEVVGEDRSPFGPVLKVRLPSTSNFQLSTFNFQLSTFNFLPSRGWAGCRGWSCCGLGWRPMISRGS